MVGLTQSGRQAKLAKKVTDETISNFSKTPLNSTIDIAPNSLTDEWRIHKCLSLPHFLSQKKRRSCLKELAGGPFTYLVTI